MVTGFLLILLGFVFAIVIFGGGAYCWIKLIWWPPDSWWMRMLLLLLGFVAFRGVPFFCRGPVYA